MKIIGCDLHTRYQQIAMLDLETGELMERRLEHESREARNFYASLQGPVRVAGGPLKRGFRLSGVVPLLESAFPPCARAFSPSILIRSLLFLQRP